MKIQNPGLKLALAAACGVIGGALGHFVFIWILHQGYSALVLPGALVGIGAGIIMKNARFHSWSSVACLVSLSG